jgi:DNA-binding transcriptional MerR regulator
VSDKLRIGELADQFGLNPKTIRYYEDIGLLPEPERTIVGYRQYGAAARERLNFIVKARAIGLALDEIGHILALSRDGQQPCEHVLTLLDRKVAAIDEQLRALTEVRGELVELQSQAAQSARSDACVCGIIEHAQSAARAGLPAASRAPRGRR